MKKIIFITTFLSVALFGEDFDYLNNTKHAFLLNSDDIYLKFQYEKLDDTVDVLDLKESENVSSSTSTTTLGDLDGMSIETAFTFWDKFLFDISFGEKELNYNGIAMTNNNANTFLRYQPYKSEKHAFAIDVGYEVNILKDISIYDIDTMNTLIDRVSSNSDISIEQSNNIYLLNYVSSSSSNTILLENTPYVSLDDTEDKAFYIRGIYSYLVEKFLFDFYLGYKEVDVKATLNSSLVNESNSIIQDALSENGLENYLYSTDRVDVIYFTGLGLTYSIGDFNAEFNYEFRKISRIDILETNSNNEKTDQNHIFDLDLSYNITDSLTYYLGARVMTNQFNGELHYLFTGYTSTTFDHKYGYAKTGLIYRW